MFILFKQFKIIPTIYVVNIRYYQNVWIVFYEIILVGGREGVLFSVIDLQYSNIICVVGIGFNTNNKKKKVYILPNQYRYDRYRSLYNLAGKAYDWNR